MPLLSPFHPSLSHGSFLPSAPRSAFDPLRTFAAGLGCARGGPSLNSSARRVPEGACCFTNCGGASSPRKDIAYKRLDVRVAKIFKMPWGHELTADFEAFNVFNWLNSTCATSGSSKVGLNLLDGIGRGTVTSPSFLFGTSPK